MGEPLVQGVGPRRPVPPAPESLDIRQRARRDRIVDAAVALMLEHDHDAVQMKDVTARAGVALGTMYRYFSSKEHLFAEAMLRWSEQFPLEVDERSAGPAVDRLKQGYRWAVRAFERHPTVHGHLLAVQATTDPVAATVFERFGRRQTAAFATFLPRVASPRRERIVAVMSAVLDGSLREWTLGREPIETVYASIDSAAELLLG